MRPELLFHKDRIQYQNNVLLSGASIKDKASKQTNSAFSKKWISFSESGTKEQNIYNDFQKDWFLKLYGFSVKKNLGITFRTNRPF